MGDAASPPNDRRVPTELDEYLFDLRGYVVVENALSEAKVAALNEAVDGILPMEPNSWHGHVYSSEGDPAAATSLQQIYELPPFETLIDHPSWIGYMLRFVGGEGTFDYNHGPLYIDENFFQLFPEGEGTVIHSGGTPVTQRTRYDWHDGEFRCGQVNALVALNDIGPGDGATMVIPGSHKSNMQLPDWEDHEGDTLEDVPEAEEVHMEAGDALIFVDGIAHGSATRTNPGERRMCVFRYGPSWGVSRGGYEPSEDLLERLTPYQRQLVKTFGSVGRRTPPNEA